MIRYVVDIWEAWKIKLYGDDSSQSQSSTGDLGELRGRVVRICVREVSLTLVSFHSSYIGMNVCGSAYENGCVVDDMYATAAD